MKKNGKAKKVEEIEQDDIHKLADEINKACDSGAETETKSGTGDEKDSDESDFDVQPDSALAEPETKENGEDGSERFNVTKRTEVAIKDIVIPEKLLRTISNEENEEEDGRIDDLATSIDHDGLLHPPLITIDGTLVAGYRRIQACKKLKWKKIPVNIIAIPDEDRYRKSLIENLQRKQMTPAEEGNAFWELLKDKKRYPTQKALAEDLGIRPARVTTSLQAAGKGNFYDGGAEKKKAAVEAAPKLKYSKMDEQNLPPGVVAGVSKTKVKITFEFDLDDENDAKEFSISKEVIRVAKQLIDERFAAEMNIVRKNA